VQENTAKGDFYHIKRHAARILIL